MLGLQNYENQLSQRTYEILASQGCLLTIDTPAIRKRFSNGKDLLTTSSPEQTVDIVKYYLDNPGECTRIGRSGQNNVLNESYTNKAQYMIEILKKEKII